MRATASALLYLCLRSAQNLVLARLRRLRQPKYLFGAALALAYVYFIFIYPHTVRAARRAERLVAEEGAPLVRDIAELVTSAVALSMLLMIAALWLWRRARASLQFSEAEIAWLFPGPVAHAALVHYSLLRGQVALLFTTALMTLVSANWDFVLSPWWARAAGWWLLFGTMTLHTVASGFTLTRLLDRGVTQWQRQLAVLTVLATALWLMNRAAPQLRLPSGADYASPDALLMYARQQVSSGPLYWLLAPLRALVAPLVAADLPQFLRALAPALGLYALHYAWAFYSEVPDSETTIANAAKRAHMVTAMRKDAFRFSLAPPRSRRDPFRLAGRGSPLPALLWKNLLSTREYLNPRTFLAFAGFLVVWNLWLGTPERLGAFARIPTIIALFIGAQALFVGAQLARQDLRGDLDNADLIKTWPLQGWQVVLGELLTPLLILTGIVWLCLLQVVLGLHMPAQEWLTPQWRWTAGLSLALVLPCVCAMQLLLANSTVVLFPAWAKATRQGHGWEAAGPRLLFLAASMLALMLTLLPALLFGLLVYVPASWYVESFAVLPAALIVALVMAGELAWGINWLGERFDAYDLSA